MKTRRTRRTRRRHSEDRPVLELPLEDPRRGRREKEPDAESEKKAPRGAALIDFYV